MRGWVGISLLVALVAGSLIYTADAMVGCWGRGALVKNAYGGLSCIPSANP